MPDTAHKQALDDAGVRKAIQQVIGTAVKHRTECVEIKLDGAFTHAEFVFEDGHRSSVEVNVHPAAFSGGLLRRGQVSGRTDDGFEAACRVDFRSSSVNCFADFTRGEEKSAAAEAPWVRLVLRDFSVEDPDDPDFWLSLPADTSLALRRIFRESNGIFVVTGQDEPARMRAVQAVMQSYPDCQFVESLPDAPGSPSLLQDAKNERVLVNLAEADVLEAAAALALILPQDHLSLLRGVFSYYQLPRLCPFCAKSLNAMPPRPLWLPDYINFAGAGAKFAPGCAMCSQTGTVGFAGVSSVADCVSPGGVRITPGAGLETLAEVFVCAGAGSLWENGVRCYWAGDAALDAVRMLPKPCAAYELVCKRAGAESAPGGKGRDFTPEDGICLPEADLNWSAEDGARGMPVSGPDAFKMRAASKEKSQRSRPAVLEHLAEGLPEKTDTIELVRPRTGNAPLLLVVDDDADQREILRRVFEMEGYTVETAADGIDGIVSANRLMPDLIIVDFMMPDLDGRETIRRLKKNPQTTRIPVIALTAYSDPDVEYGLLKAGADDFCAKSVAKKVLMKRIEKLAGKP